MTRRLLLSVALVAACLAALPSLAFAQFGPYGPGGGIIVSTDQVSASTQVATAQSIIPSSMATPATTLCMAQHCQLDVSGILASRTTASGSSGTFSVAFSYGGISCNPFSARSLEQGLNNVPWNLNVRIAPDSSIAAGSGGVTGKTIECNFTYVPSNTAGTTPITYMVVSTGTITFTGTQAMVATITFTDTTTQTGAIARRQWFGAGS